MVGVALVAGLNPTPHGTSWRQPCSTLQSVPKEKTISSLCRRIRAQVRFLAYHRIKPHAPPLVRTPVNSFEFQSCDRTPQVAHLTLSLGRWLSIANSEWASFTVRTTRVSNPVRYPHFRTLASVTVQQAAFAIGVLYDIYAFHRYIINSAYLYRTQDWQYQSQFYG